MKRIKVKIGDIYALPLGNGEYAYAQLIDITPFNYFVVYDYKSSTFPEVQNLVEQKIIILTNTVDVFIKDLRWPFVGNISPPSGVIIPNFIVGRLKDGKEQIIVVDYHGNYLRGATKEDKKTLLYQSSVSPAFLEHIAKHQLLGVGRSYPDIEKVFYKDTRK
jgi:hypothetical protein